MPKDDLSEWMPDGSLNSKVRVGVFVDGKVVNTDNSTQDDKTKGYTIEFSIDKELIGLDETGLLFTGGFVQDKGYYDTRLGNTFLIGGHKNPSSWKKI